MCIFFFFWPCLNLWDWPLVSCIRSLSQTQDFQDRLGNILPKDLALIYLNEMKIGNSFFLIMSYCIKGILYPFKWKLKSLQRRAKPDSLGLFFRARDQIHVLARLETWERGRIRWGCTERWYLLPVTNLCGWGACGVTSLPFAQLLCAPHWRVLGNESTDRPIQECGGKRAFSNTFASEPDWLWAQREVTWALCRGWWDWQGSGWRLRSVCVGLIDSSQNNSVTNGAAAFLWWLGNLFWTWMADSPYGLWFLVRDPTVWALGASWFLAGTCPALLGTGRRLL